MTTDVTTENESPVATMEFVAPPTPQVSAPPSSRLGALVLQEIARRLPNQYGLSPTQASLVDTSTLVAAVFGRFFRVEGAGLNLGLTSSLWDEIGVVDTGARAAIFTRPPMKELAPKTLFAPLRTIYSGLVDAQPKYGTYFAWYGAYWYSFKSERSFMDVARGCIASFNRYRDDEILPKLEPVWNSYTVPRLRAAAEEAYTALVATDTPPCSKSEFVERLIARAKKKFPTPTTALRKIRLTIVEALPPDKQPPEHLIEAALDLKSLVEAETREQQARTEQAVAVAQTALFQAEMTEMQANQERQLIQEMHLRRLAEAEGLIRQQAQETIAPYEAAFDHGRAVIAEAVMAALEDVRIGKPIPPARIKSLKKATELCRLLTVGNADFEKKLKGLHDILQLPSAKRGKVALHDALADLEATTRLEAERIRQADADAARWQNAFTLFGGTGDASEKDSD